MRTLLTTLLAATSAFTLAFTAPSHAATTTGSGRVAAESRAVSGFDAIAISGSMELTVRQGTTEAVEVRADDNVLPLIETVVENRTLAVRFKRGSNVYKQTAVKVTVDVIRLAAITSSGSGDVLVEALKTPSLKLTLAGASDARLRKIETEMLEVGISGSGDVSAAGSARQVRLSIAGSGDAELAQLTADDVNIRIAGSGNANVTANKALDVSIAGSGDVRYGGSVTAIKSSMAGSGSINRR